MKTKSIFILLLILTTLSCTKVVDINLNATDPKLIIEGTLSDQFSSCIVKLSKTVNFDEPNVFPVVSGAVVTISDDYNNRATLSETEPGTYTAPYIRGSVGRTYSLSVTSAGKTYTATSVIPESVTIDSITQGSFVMGHFGRTGTIKFIEVHFKDPAGEKNYYRFIEKKNGKVLNDIHIDNDLLRDGNSFSQNIEHNETGLKTGDSVTVYLQTIDKDVFFYLGLLRETIGQGSRGPTFSPGTSPSTFSNGAIGYFSANSVRSRTIVIE